MGLHSNTQKSQTIIFLLLIVFVCISGIIASEYLVRFGRNHEIKNLLDLTELAAASIDAPQLILLKGDAEEVNTAAYKAIKKQLMRLREELPIARFFYIMILKEKQVVFIADSEPSDSEDISLPGDIYSDASPELIHALETGESITEGPLKDQWGVWVTGAAAIHHPDTKSTLGVLGIDIAAKRWKDTIFTYRILGYSITGSVLVLIFCIFLFFQKMQRANQVIWKEISEREKTKNALNKTEKNLQTILMSVQTGILVVDEKEHRVISANPAALSILGRSEKDVISKPYDQLITLPRNTDQIAGEMSGVESVFVGSDGRKIHVLKSVAKISLDENIQFLESFVDISKQKEAEEKLASYSRQLEEINKKLTQLSFTDPLTGLYNRRLLMDHLINERKRSKRSGQPFSVALLDLDHFKSVNDNYGHDIGDEVLKATATTMQRSTRGEDCVARYGGEEFCILFVNSGNGEHEIACERLRRNIAEDVSIPTANGDNVTVTCSIGLAQWDIDKNETIESVLKRADQALYHAKKTGRNRVHCA